MPVRIVQSKQNACLKELRRALSHPGRERHAAVEGPVLVSEALRSGMRIRCVLAAQETAPLLASLALPHGVDVLLFPRNLLDPVLTTENPQSVAALIEPPQWNWPDVLERQTKNALVVILAGIQDPGNLGTIVRSAEAFGATGIVSLPGTVSAWNPKAVRASAGSIFRVPFLAVDETECFENLRHAGIRILSTALQDAEPVHAIDLAQPVAIVLGNEGNGVPPELAAKCDAAITIPCPGPVESLNASVAAGIVLYEAARQRAALA